MKQADRGVGNLLRQHVGRVGHHHAGGARMLGIDMVVADTEAGDDLKIGQGINEGSVNTRHHRCRAP
jgi:hypothetical protein